MSLKIIESSFVTKNVLKIDSSGLVYSDMIGSSRKFSFGDIVCILMSEDNVLSFQVGEEVFKIKVKPEKKEHQMFLVTLLQEVGRAAGRNIPL